MGLGATITLFTEYASIEISGRYIISCGIQAIVSPFLLWQILDFPKLKEFADDNVKFDKNGEKFSKGVESAVGKGEIAHNEQFLLFPLKRILFQTRTRHLQSWVCLGKG